MFFSWMKKKLESCGFVGDKVDEDDFEFVPVSSLLGDYIRKKEFADMTEGVVAVEFIPIGVVELYRVGPRQVFDGHNVYWRRGLWPLNGSPNTRDQNLFNEDTYGTEWRAFHVNFPINAKELFVIRHGEFED